MTLKPRYAPSACPQCGATNDLDAETLCQATQQMDGDYWCAGSDAQSDDAGRFLFQTPESVAEEARHYDKLMRQRHRLDVVLSLFGRCPRCYNWSLRYAFTSACSYRSAPGDWRNGCGDAEDWMERQRAKKSDQGTLAISATVGPN